MIKITTIFLGFLYLAGSYRCDAQTVADTLNKAKQLRTKGKMHKSYVLLKKCQSRHPDDLNVTWYTAQTAYWAHRPGKSKRLYEDAIRQNPKNLYLQLDYAKILVNLGDFKKAQPLLDTYLKFDSVNSQALTAVAKILFWQSEYRAARGKVKRALLTDPEYSEASTLLKEIDIASAPSISLSTGYGSDDQPQQVILPVISSGIYLHPLSTLHFSLKAPVFMQGKNIFLAQEFSFGNLAFIRTAGMTIDLSTGAVRFPYKNTLNWTGNAEINKTFIRHLVLSLKADRSPYFWTRSSVDTVVMQNHLSLSLEWNNINSWNGKAAIDGFTYSTDNNYAYGGYAWIFAPPARFSGFRLNFGYGYSYSNSEKNHFVPENPLEIRNNPSYTEKVTGIYDPYFTPSEQKSHSALLVLTGKIFHWMDFSVNANMGFYATVQVPFYYVNFYIKNIQRDTIKYFAKGVLNTNYNPVSVTVLLLIKLSDRIHLQAEYRYNSTYYFTSNYAGVGLNIRLMHAKNAK